MIIVLIENVVLVLDCIFFSKFVKVYIILMLLICSEINCFRPDMTFVVDWA